MTWQIPRTFAARVLESDTPLAGHAASGWLPVVTRVPKLRNAAPFESSRRTAAPTLSSGSPGRLPFSEHIRIRKTFVFFEPCKQPFHLLALRVLVGPTFMLAGGTARKLFADAARTPARPLAQSARSGQVLCAAGVQDAVTLCGHKPSSPSP